MRTDKIGLKTTPMLDKINSLKQITDKLEKEDLVTSLLFGQNNVAFSKGQSADAMEALNKEYASAAKKLSVLIEATIKFLMNTTDRFESVDNGLATQFSNKNAKPTIGVQMQKEDV